MNQPNTITIDDVVYVRKDSIQDVKIEEGENFFKVGAKLLINCVTKYHVGQVVRVDEKSVTLSKASWVAKTGRLGSVLENGFDNVSEYEYVNLVQIQLGAVIDVYPWNHDLPNKSY